MISLADNSWLAKHIDDPEIRIIDPRPRVKYLQGHIPKAANLSLAEVFDKETLGLHSSDRLADVIGRAGVDMDSTVVLYDSYDGQSAGMLAWLLEYLGKSQVSILSNYVEGWAKNAGKILYRPVENQAKTFNRKIGHSRAGIDEVLKREDAKLLDLRAEEEFHGKISTEPRSGHIPGAINLPWTELIGRDGSFLRSNSELNQVFSNLGLKPSDEMITYCTNGPRAALGYIALQQSGFNKIRVYDGSFHQWARRTDLPVEQGTDELGLKPKPLGPAGSPCIIDNMPGLTRN